MKNVIERETASKSGVHQTEEFLTQFLKKCEELGKTQRTRQNYYGYLRHFAGEHPELPLETFTIEAYLKKRKETPAHRGMHFKCLQAFYSYLEKYHGIKSPVPPRGPMGRPPKRKLVNIDPVISLEEEKVVRGGQSVSTSISIYTATAVELFLKARTAQGVSNYTLRNYRSNLGKFARECPVLPLELEPVEEFLVNLKRRDGQPLDQETRWDYRRDLKALYHFLAARGKIPKDYCPVPKIKLPRKVRRVLSQEELASVFRHAQDFQEMAILSVLTDTKVRASELCSITRDKVFPDHITVAGKTGQRDVPITPEIYQVLIKLQPEGALFRTNGRPMYREKLNKIVHAIMLSAGLTGKKLGPHIIRHSASVLHMMFGGDLLSLKEELGHTTTRMTERYGALAFPQVKQKHQEVNVIGHITPGQADLAEPGAPTQLRSPGRWPATQLRSPELFPPEASQVTAVCSGCGLQIRVHRGDLMKTECLRCHQVGKWYLLDDVPEEKVEVKQ